MGKRSGTYAIGLEDSSATSNTTATQGAETKPDKLPRGSALSLATIDELAEQIRATDKIEVAHQCAAEIRSLVSELLTRYERQFA
jgi:hypothetical protein